MICVKEDQCGAMGGFPYIPEIQHIRRQELKNLFTVFDNKLKRVVSVEVFGQNQKSEAKALRDKCNASLNSKGRFVIAKGPDHKSAV